MGVGAGFVSSEIHKSAINPVPNATPYVAAFEAADQSRTFFNVLLQRKTVAP
jgi:hypothetical protein